MKLVLLGDVRPSHLKRWYEFFKSRGHECILISLEEDACYKDYMRFRTLPLPAFLKYPIYSRRLKKQLLDFKPDLVNAHFVTSYGLMAALAGIRPLVVSAWGSDILVSPHKSPFHRMRVQWVLSRCDLITSDARHMTSEIERLTKRSTGVVTQPMGVSQEFFDKAFALREPGDNRPLEIVSTRRLETLYRVDHFLRALSIIKEEIGEIKVVICGDGSERARLESLSKELNLENVSFVGWQFGADYMRVLKSADIYVSCSESDSTSVCLLEAMAAGAFPVVTSIPGNREWLEDSGTALLFQAGDINVLAASLLQACRDPELRRKAALRNRMRIEAAAIWENNMAAVEKAFEALVERHE